MKPGDKVEVRIGDTTGPIADAVWARGVVSLSNWDGTGRVNVLLESGEVYNYLSKAKKDVRFASRKVVAAEDGEGRKRKQHIQPHKITRSYHPQAVSYEYSRWCGPQRQVTDFVLLDYTSYCQLFSSSHLSCR